MTELPSIRRRLAAALLGIGVAWGMAVALAVGLVVRHEVDEVLDHGLQESAEIILSLLQVRLARDVALPSDVVYPAPGHDEALAWQIIGADGTVVSRSHRAPAQPLSDLRQRGFSHLGERWYVFALPFDRVSGRMLYVAQPGAERNEARLEAGALAAAAALVVGIVGTLLLRVYMRREFEVVAQSAASVTRFDPLGGPPLAPAARAELVPLHDAVADLGRRLAKKFANEQAFTTHAAHALRTPLAALMTNLAVAHRRAVNDEDRRFLKHSRDAAGRLRRVVSALLTMFRSGGSIRRQVFDLNDLVAEMPYWKVSLTVTAAQSAWADPDLLAAALMNLLDNAQRHGATAVTIAMRESTPRLCEITVSDNGRGIDAPTRIALQQAIDASSFEGTTGLGLMLVDLVARAHGGRLRLLSPSAGCTIAFTLAQRDARDPSESVFTFHLPRETAE